jgi:hypothetical protein
MKSKAILIARWGYINVAFFLAAFLCAGLLSLLFPETMLNLFGRWAEVLSSLGARTEDQFNTSFQMFTHILQRNALAAIVYFVIGLLLQAPLAMIFGGIFYAFIVFLAPFTIGHPFGLLDWVLITVEALALVGSASISSGFAGNVYLVHPTIGEWWGYSKRSWRSLSMKAPNSWRAMLPSWAPTILTGVLTIAGLILFVAWFEVYGY